MENALQILKIINRNLQCSQYQPSDLKKEMKVTIVQHSHTMSMKVNNRFYHNLKNRKNKENHFSKRISLKLNLLIQHLLNLTFLSKVKPKR